VILNQNQKRKQINPKKKYDEPGKLKFTNSKGTGNADKIDNEIRNKMNLDKKVYKNAKGLDSAAKENEKIKPTKNYLEKDTEKKTKKGPKIGFLNSRVNTKVFEILTESNIQCEINNEEIIIGNKKETDSNSECIDYNMVNANNVDLGYNSDFNFEFYSDDNCDTNYGDQLIKEKTINQNVNSTKINVEFVKKKMNSDSKTNIINSISILYLRYLRSNEINHEFLNNLHDIFSLNIFDFQYCGNPLRTISFQDFENLGTTMVENVPGFKTDKLHINFNLIVDFFKYSYNIALIIHPIIILFRIQQKSLSPGLLFAIYAGAYLFRPNQNKLKSKYYYIMAVRSLFRNIQKYDIQNLQTAFILSNILPGVYINYILSGITLRLVKALNLNDYKQVKDNLFYYERVNSIWLSINIDTLLNLTCNCLDHLNWLDQPIPQSVTDRMLMEHYPPTEHSIKYIVITNYLAKVIKHAKYRREGKFNREEFKALMEELESIRKHLKKDFNNFKENKIKLKNSSDICQFFIYLIFFTAKLILFNIELSPFMYQNKILPSKRYIKVRKTMHNFQSHFNSSSNNINNNINMDIPVNENLNLSNTEEPVLINPRSYYSEADFNSEYFEKRYHFFSILENISYSCSNYRIYDEINETDNNDNTLFLNIPHIINDMDYESCYYVCLNTVELAKNVLNEINDVKEYG